MEDVVEFGQMTCKSQEYVDDVTLSICINGRCCRIWTNDLQVTGIC